MPLRNWQLDANKVDVNEQNAQAVRFNQHCGFNIISRSSLDAMGKPFSIIHMALESKSTTLN